MKASLAISILPALLAMGSCLQCEVCNGLGNNCTGSMQTCTPGQDSCGISVTESTLEGTKLQSIVKGCVPSHKCKATPISVTFGKGLTTRTNTSCCMGDSCRTITVTAPPANTIPNGWSCRGCYSLSSGQCQEETIDCTGAETQCITVTETLIPDPAGKPLQVIMKGCASESFCTQLKAGSRTFAGITANLTMAECTAPSVAGGMAPGAAGHLLLMLVGLLLLKLLS